MSVVIGYKYNNQVYIGADSCITYKGNKYIDTNINNVKVYKFPNGILIGAVGNSRDFNVIKTMKIDIYNNFDYKFVVRYLVPKIVSELKEYGYLSDDDKFEHMGSSYIVAYKDKLFHIENDGSVSEVDKFVATGCGEPEAYGSLYTNKSEDPEEIIRDAIKATSMHDVDVSMPAIIMNTLTDDVKIVE